MADSLGNIGKRRMTMKGNPHIGIITHVIRLGSQIGRFDFPNREIDKTKNEILEINGRNRDLSGIFGPSNKNSMGPNFSRGSGGPGRN